MMQKLHRRCGFDGKGLGAVGRSQKTKDTYADDSPRSGDSRQRATGLPERVSEHYEGGRVESVQKRTIGTSGSCQVEGSAGGRTRREEDCERKGKRARDTHVTVLGLA